MEGERNKLLIEYDNIEGFNNKHCVNFLVIGLLNCLLFDCIR